MKDLEELLAAVKDAFPGSDCSVRVYRDEDLWTMILDNNVFGFNDMSADGKTISEAFEKLCERVTEVVDATIGERNKEVATFYASIIELRSKRYEIVKDINTKTRARARIAGIAKTNTGEL